MGYQGQTVLIDFSKGGFTASPNIDNVPAYAMIEGTKNINLHNGGRQPRGGTSKDNGTAVSGSPRIMGLHDFRLKNGNVFKVFATADGKIYKDYTNTIKTGLGTTKISHFEVYRDELFISNGFNVPQTWNGVAASTSDITLIPTDWTGNNFPRQIIKHGRGESERMWAILPNGVYASKNEDGKDFSNANVILIPIETGDGFGVVAGIEFGDRLICFGKRKSYIINDESLTTANWGYSSAQWEGGVAHWRLLVKTPNDLVAMTEEGEIYSVISAQEYGDYKQASLTTAAWMHKWIRDNLNLALIEEFHGVYDPFIRAIRFYVIRSGATTTDTCMLYFIDRPPDQAWMIHDNLNYASGYNASCAALFRKSAGVYKVYTGDYSGFVWESETVSRNDNSNPYNAGFKMPNLNMNNPRTTKMFSSARLVQQPKGNFNTSLNWWVDGNQRDSKTIAASISGGLVGSFIIGTSLIGSSNQLTDSATDLGEVGKRIQIELNNNNLNEDFFFTGLEIDYREEGALP